MLNWKLLQRCRFTDRQVADNILSSSNNPEEYRQLLESYEISREVYTNTALKINSQRWLCTGRRHVLWQLFHEEWPAFSLKHAAMLSRPGVKEAVDRMTECGNPENGFVTYICPKCGERTMVTMTCKSRFCPKCGQKAREKITNSVSAVLADVPHRQMVLSIPPDLRPLFRKYRDPLLEVLFATASQTIDFLLESKAPLATKHEHRRLGYIMFLHTYGRDLKWHPHLHILIAERYMAKDRKLHRYSYFPFDFIRMTFMNSLLANVYLAIKDIAARKDLRDYYSLRLSLPRKYPKGYYVYSPRIGSSEISDGGNDGKRIRGMKSLTRYVARYASHPAISESRILSYDPETRRVTWYYEPHQDDSLPDDEKIGEVQIEEDVDAFISKLLIHIPTKGFKMIRYYGFYSQASKIKPAGDQKMMTRSQVLHSRLMETYEAMMLKYFGFTPFICHCGTRMVPCPDLSYIPEGKHGFT